MLDNIQKVHNTALIAAFEAAKAKHEVVGERDACGFAWVTVYEKGTTKLGRALKNLGFSKAYGSGLQYWNPSKFGSQSVSVLEAGALAYVAAFRQAFPEIKIQAGSRLD